MRRGPLPAVVGFALMAMVACANAPADAQDFSACYLSGATLEAAMERPSPLGATTVTLDGDQATLCYGRPSAKERQVMGGLVPRGAPWRMGANEATAIHLPFPADIGGVQVGPGDYSLYAVPEEGSWTVFVNRSAERWGIPINSDVRAADVGSFERPAETTGDMVEQLTFAWQQDGPGAGRLVLTWEHTRVEIPIRRGGA